MGINTDGTPKKTSYINQLKDEIASVKRKPDSMTNANAIVKLGIAGIPPAEVAKITQTPISRVKQLLSGITDLLTNHDPKRLDAYREHKLSILEAIEAQLLQSLVSPEKIEKAPLNQVAYSVEVIHKMRRLEEGKSTDNTMIFMNIGGDKYK